MSAKHVITVVACATTVLAARVAGQGQIWLPAACDIKPGNPLVDHGMQSLRDAAGTKFADQRTKDLKDAERNLTQAVTTGKQEKNPAAWYYLGRYYLTTDDAVGADSALAKALTLAPTCKDDIALYRRQAWVPVFNAGVQAWQAGVTDSAIRSFRRANQVYKSEPMGFIYIANLFITVAEPDSAARHTPDSLKYRADSTLYATRMDSAAKYFRLAVPAAADPKYAKERRDALFNVARVYHSIKRYDEAVAAYREYLAVPAYANDAQALASLSGLLMMHPEKRDSALALDNQIVAHSTAASVDELFGAAQAIVAVVPQSPDTAVMNVQCAKAAKKRTPALTARQIAARCVPVSADTMRKFHASADTLYHLATVLYDTVLNRNPYHRDALYNLAGISYLIGDTGRVLPLAQRLYEVDPMNRTTLTKVAGGWQLRGKKDSVLYYLQIADSLPMEINVTQFTTSEKGAEVEAQATNLRAKADSLTLKFEFLDAKGTVLSSKSQALRLAPNANQSFKVKADTATGIAAWRYRRS
ncbi:MAG TPA: hypothetical protein VM736_04610 [Gemmatimonadales bacterium]|nr:hypothetical protein [Gemmatimonadales bacterium]